MRLDGARVQAEAAELSRSRCLGCCQRLGVGKQPGDGDRVSGRGERLKDLEACRKGDQGWRPQDQEMLQGQDWEVVGVQ